MTAGIRRDINVKEMIVFIKKVEEFCLTLQKGEAFIHFTKNSPIRTQVQSLIAQNLHALKLKQAELAAIFNLGDEWVEKTFRRNVSDVRTSNPFVHGVHGVKGLKGVLDYSGLVEHRNASHS